MNSASDVPQRSPECPAKPLLMSVRVARNVTRLIIATGLFAFVCGLPGTWRALCSIGAMLTN